MKIENISLQNYRRFVQSKTFSFCNSDGEVNEKTLIIGRNGTGKSSVLQAFRDRDFDFPMPATNSLVKDEKYTCLSYKITII